MGSWSMGVFLFQGRIIPLVVRLVMRLKYKEGHIMRLDELSFEICLERRTTKGSSSGRIKRLAPVFILETNNQTNYKMFAQVRPDG